MAAKKTVFLNQSGRVRQIRQRDINELKEAIRNMIDDYMRVKQAQNRFEESLEKLCMKVSPWSIPHRKVQAWRKGLR